MKLRFAVNQGECLRRGIECESSTETIEVVPAKLPQEERDLLADRMKPGDIQVYRRDWKPVSTASMSCITSELICADTPGYAGLIEAVRKDQKKIDDAIERQKSNAENFSRFV